jgi:S-adenosylmethionine hydrolase
LASSRIEGNVVAITAAGNLVTNITSEQLEGAPRDERVRIRCDEHETNGIFPVNHGEPESTFLALLNGDGALELAIVGLSAKDMLGIRVGERVIIEW